MRNGIETGIYGNTVTHAIPGLSEDSHHQGFEAFRLHGRHALGRFSLNLLGRCTDVCVQNPT
jgi:hypothetical protein